MDHNQISTYKGIIKRVLFVNSENGYSVIKVQLDDQKDETTAVGFFSSIEIGTYINFKAEEIEHPKFGTQLKIINYFEDYPENIEDLTDYLSSGFIQNLGLKTAKKITDKFGTDSIDIIRDSPEKLTEIKGISLNKAKKYSTIIQEKASKIDTEIFFNKLNLTNNLINQIIKNYGTNAISLISKNPYLLIDKIGFIGFKRADQIAYSLNITEDNPVRVKAAIVEVIRQSQNNGHAYLFLQQIKEGIFSLIGLDDEHLFEESIQDLINKNYLISEEDKIYLLENYNAEKTISQIISKLYKENNYFSDINSNIPNSITITEKEQGFKLSSQQIDSLTQISNKNLLLITGGPGSGKTTILKAIVNLLNESDIMYSLAAPTGKAAQRMGEITGLAAQTIHRLLKYNGFTKEFEFNTKNRITSSIYGDREIECLIIDESSMLDLPIFNSLLKALPENCKLILIGDKDQLPSIGAGRIFADLVEIETIPKCVLTKIFRQNSDSEILNIAYQINNSKFDIETEEINNKNSDVFLINRKNSKKCIQTINELFIKRIPEKFNIDSENIYILSATNKSDIGTINLNNTIQEKLNPESKNYIEIGIKKFFIGDRVCQRSNNYNIDPKGVFNGDIGEIININHSDQSIQVKLWDQRIINYKKNDINQLSLSYSMSIHRSQGSEIDCVILVISRSQFHMLDKKLLYTAVTRAKKLLIIIGDIDLIKSAVKKAKTDQRQCYLKERILKIIN